MAFPPQFLDELRARVGLADLIGRRTKLVRKGREFSGLCPFHNEKTPSFTVNEDKGFYHCFGCGAHGDHIKFVMETEGTSFLESVERLANLAGMQIPVASPAQKKAQEKAAGQVEILEMAAQWYQAQLATQGGRKAQAYLDKRGVSDAAIKGFRLGFAPSSRTGLKDSLMARGVHEDKLIEAGLLIKPDDGGPGYDRFRDRLMFPIEDRRGQVIAFGGRALAEQKAKYLNSPETELFHKGHILYNMAAARKKAFEAGNVIVAEGYMDVIALSEAGFGQAVAPLGTAVTEDQLRMLWRMAPEPILCLDGDAAGWKAALRAAERALPLLQPGHSLRFALLPEGQDPDDVVRNKGAAEMAGLLSAARPLSDILWRKETDGRSVNTPERKALVEKSLYDLCDQIQDPAVRGYYRNHFKNELWNAFNRSGKSGYVKGNAAGDKTNRFAGQRANRLTSRPSTLSGKGKLGRQSDDRREELMMAIMLNHPQLLAQNFEVFAGLQLRSNPLEALRRAMVDITAGESGLDYAGMKRHLGSRNMGELVASLGSKRVSSLNWFAGPDAALEDAEKGWCHVLARHQKDALQQELDIAQLELGKNATAENLDRLKYAKSALEQAEGKEAELEDFGLASGRDVNI